MLDTFLQFVFTYGYIGIFLALVLGIVGLPIPDEVLMTSAGFLISLGKLQYVPTVMAAFAGSICGMIVSFYVGHKLGLPFLERYGHKFHITTARLSKMERWFRRFGKFTVTIGYFVPGLRHVTAYLAAISQWPLRTFLCYAVPGGLVWATTFVTLGTLLGHHWRALFTMLYHYFWLGILIILAAVVFWQAIRRSVKLNSK